MSVESVVNPKASSALAGDVTLAISTVAFWMFVHVQVTSSPAARSRFSFDASAPSTAAVPTGTTMPVPVSLQTMSFSAQPASAPSAIESVPGWTNSAFDAVPPAFSGNVAAENSGPRVPLAVNVNALLTPAGSVALMTVSFASWLLVHVQVTSSPAARSRFSFEPSTPSTSAVPTGTTTPLEVSLQTMPFSAQPVSEPSAIVSAPGCTNPDFDVVPPAFSGNVAAENSAPRVPPAVNVNALSTPAGSVALTTV